MPGFSRSQKRVKDKAKQDAFYVRVNANGIIVSEPLDVSQQMAENIIEGTSYYSKAITYILQKDGPLFNYNEIKNFINKLFNPIIKEKYEER